MLPQKYSSIIVQFHHLVSSIYIDAFISHRNVFNKRSDNLWKFYTFNNINIKFKFFRIVHCLFDPTSNVADGNILVPLQKMMWQVMGSPPSRRSDESPDPSNYSTTDYDPYESRDELYVDSE